MGPRRVGATASALMMSAAPGDIERALKPPLR
jgi:hypothetical protein